ncbi:MAG: DNA polymerase I [Alphaproteobacteria bacterium MarineAlpha6_Bin1]|nr:MAG: DNA polymerase I [Alphaproteobacteria bacterium MarineAlpha6_Bin1]
MKNLFLIDGSGLIFRAFYALPPLTNPEGTPINAVLGYCNMIINIVDTFKPDQLIVVFDTKRKTFRNDIYKSYKSNRVELPEELIPQFTIIREATKALDLPQIEMDGYEADDIIATYASKAEKQGIAVTIISSDKDLMQLVNKKTKMYDSMRNNYIGTNEVKEKFGVDPSKVVDVQALAGDSVDNIPGVSGIGIKTAAELINTFGNLNNLFSQVDKIKQPKRKQALIDEQDNALISKKLATLKKDVPIKSYTFQLFKGINQKKGLEFFEKHGFKNLIAKFNKKNPKENINKKQKKNEKKYQIIESVDHLKKIIKGIQRQKLVVIDTETNSLNANLAKLVGMSFYFEEDKSYYLPLEHKLNKNEKTININFKEVYLILKNLLEDTSIMKIGHNIKYDKIVLANFNIDVHPIEDTMLLSYVLDAGKFKHNLDDLAKIYLDYDTIKYKDVVGVGKKEKTFDQLSIEEAYKYAAEDADITLKLYHILKKRIVEEKLVNVYENIEKPLVDVLVNMERNGIKIDVKKLKKLSSIFLKKIFSIQKEIFKYSKFEFNIASTKQLGEVLFDKMGIQGGKKGKSGAYSTSSEILENLSYQGHEIAKFLLEWRQISKLKNTYTESLTQEINTETSRIHTSYSMASTSTGRLSSTNPNLQNIPIRTEEGKKIRNAFISEKGYKLVSLDYSQIELRLLAHIGKVNELKKAFDLNLDIHKETASQIFNKPIDKIDNNLRRKAKTINYGIIYGISAFGLSKQLNITRSDADFFLKEYFKKYKGILDYIDETTNFCKKNGFVKTIFGRKCFIAGINNKNPNFRNFAIRAAINAPIQGSAADIIKKAMIKIYKFFNKNKVKSKLILQVHDELLFEIPESEITYLTKEITNIMEKAILPDVILNVPLVVDVGKGDNWAEAH